MDNDFEISDSDRDIFKDDISLDQKDPIMEAWEKSGKLVDFKTYLENRNKSARKNGFESAYAEYYSNLAKSRELAKSRIESEKKPDEEKEPAE